MNPSVVYASTWLASMPPVYWLPQTWSVTLMTSNPAASAASTISTSVVLNRAAPPSQFVATIANPSFTIGLLPRAQFGSSHVVPASQLACTTSSVVSYSWIDYAQPQRHGTETYWAGPPQELTMAWHGERSSVEPTPLGVVPNNSQ